MSGINKGVTVYVISKTDEIVGRWDNNTENGQILEVKCSEKKIGGLDKFTISIARDFDIPLFNDFEVEIYVDDNKWYRGKADFIPVPDQNDPVLKIKGDGFYSNLKKKVIDRSYVNETLGNILIDIGSNEFGSDIDVFYNLAKLSPPAIFNIDVEFKDKTIQQALLRLLEIANNNYSSQQYTLGVDNVKDFYFQPIDTDIIKTYFEGYDYFDPQAKLDDKVVVNRINTYRTTSADDKETEFVATYEDTESQTLYGLREKKLTFPDFVDTTTISEIAAGILQEHNEPKRQNIIRDFQTTEPLEIGFYRTVNKRNEYLVSLSNCESLTGWDDVPAPNLGFVLATDDVLTGRSSFKFTLTDGVTDGEYVEFTFDDPIPGPYLLRAFARAKSDDAIIAIEYEDTNGSFIDIQFDPVPFVSITDYKWTKKEVPCLQQTSIDNLVVNPSIGVTDNLVANLNGVDPADNLVVGSLVVPGIKDVKKIRIKAISGTGVVYVDRIDCFSNSYVSSDLILEKIDYKLTSLNQTAKIAFGQDLDTLSKEMMILTEDGRVSFDIYSK